jgi:hypothetical protein
MGSDSGKESVRTYNERLFRVAGPRRIDLPVTHDRSGWVVRRFWLVGCQ